MTTSVPPPDPHTPIIDVERIVEDIRERAAVRRAHGGYDLRIADARLDIRPDRITLRPETAYSSKPVIGRLITGAKRTLIKLQYHFLDDVVSQTNRALEIARAQVKAESERRTELEKRIAHLEARLAGADITESNPDSGDDASRPTSA